MNLKKYLPLESKELHKFFLTSMMMVLTIFVYSLLRGTKDALIISECGAEMISTLKLYGVLPSAILITLAYTKLADYFSRVTTYNILVWFFVGFFVFFDFFLYPNAKLIHFDLSSLGETYPVIKYPLIMIGTWSFSLFYIMSELWGSAMLSLMFWQIANQINTTTEAKRSYALFGFIGQIGLLSSGILMGVFTSDTYADSWRTSIHYICLSVLVSGILLSTLMYFLKQKVGGNVMNGESVKKKKSKPGLWQSLKVIFSSKYIGLIAALIVCYGISINLVEGVWKKQIGTMFPDPSDIGGFMSQVQIYTAIATFVAMLLGTYMLRFFSWRVVAVITPIVILLTGTPFFLFVIFQEPLGELFAWPVSTILFLAVIFGAAQNVLSKAIKYSFFDPTKEMSYIPLDEELKSKGKAAAEVIGTRLGKSGGGVVQWGMLAFIAGSTLTSLAPQMFVVFLVIMIVWIVAVFRLAKEFTAKSTPNA